MRRTIRLFDQSRSVTLAWAQAGSPGPSRGDAFALGAALRPFFRGENLPLLRGFLAHDPATGPLHRHTDTEVIELAVSLVRRGLVLAEVLAAPAFSVRDGDATESEPPPGAQTPRTRTEPKTWIEIELLDMADQPVPNIRYVIELADGSARTGTLDQRGRARVDGIDPGQCNVRFPDFDQDAWERI